MARKHGTKNHYLSQTPEWQAWKQAKKRCYNMNDKDYARWGGRGISMCDAWRDSFLTFYKDMGLRPAQHTLERVDVNGNYEPGNCVWASHLAQQSNRRNTIRVQFSCQEMALKTACRLAEVSYPAIHHRIQRYGLTFYQALNFGEVGDGHGTRTIRW